MVRLRPHKRARGGREQCKFYISEKTKYETYLDLSKLEASTKYYREKNINKK